MYRIKADSCVFLVAAKMSLQLCIRKCNTPDLSFIFAFRRVVRSEDQLQE